MRFFFTSRMRKHFAVDLFRRSSSASGRIYVDDDGLDGTVVTKLAQLFDHILGRQDYTFKVHDGDLVTESRKGVLLLSARREIYKRKHRQ